MWRRRHIQSVAYRCRWWMISVFSSWCLNDNDRPVRVVANFEDVFENEDGHLIRGCIEADQMQVNQS